MSINCTFISEEDVKKLPSDIQSLIKNNLNKEELQTIATEICSPRGNINTIIEESPNKFREAINNFIKQRELENTLKGHEEDNTPIKNTSFMRDLNIDYSKLEGTNVSIKFRGKDNPYREEDPQKEPNTAFVFTENAQAYTATHRYMSTKTKDSIISEANPENTKINVSDMATSKTPNTAGIRSIDGQTQQENVFGLTVKKYQQLNGFYSKFVGKEGQLKDTKEDKKIFITYLEDFYNQLTDFMKSHNGEVVFPTSFALGRAAMPYSFAETLQDFLSVFGIETVIKETETPGYSGYGVAVTEMSDFTFNRPKDSTIEFKRTSDVDISKLDEDSTSSSPASSKEYKEILERIKFTVEKGAADESVSTSYHNRTVSNAKHSDITLAFAVDFNTKGEKLTKSSVEEAKKTYIPVSLEIKNKKLNNSKEWVKQTVDSIETQIEESKAPFKDITLNIAGNTLSKLKSQGISQDNIDNLVTEVIKELVKRGVTIENIRSGGQSGVDEAGIKAALNLKINPIVRAPKGYLFENSEGKHVKDKEAFIKRFFNDKDWELYQKADKLLGKELEYKRQQEEKIKEAVKSLQAERPKSEIDKSTESITLLKRVFPNVVTREGYINAVSSLFSNCINYKIQEIIDAYKDLPEDDPDYELSQKMFSGTAEDTRKFILNLEIESEDAQGNSRYISIAQDAIEDIYNMMKGISYASQNRAKEEGINQAQLQDIQEKVINNFILDEDAITGRNFWLQARDRGWDSKTINNQAAELVNYLSNAYYIIMSHEDPNTGENPLFNALLKKASADIEYREKIRLSGDFSSVINDDSNIEEPQEESADTRSGLGVINMKTIEPSKRQSIRVRRLLSSLRKYKKGREGKYRIQFDKFCNPILLNPDETFRILENEFSSMSSPEEFMEKLNTITEKYHWAKEFKEKVLADEDLRNEIYSQFRNVFVTATTINADGTIAYLNRKSDIKTFLFEVNRHYENAIVLGTKSIYSETGSINTSNADDLRRMLRFPAKDKVRDKTKHPLAHAREVLRTLKRQPGKVSIDDVIEVISWLKNGVTMCSYTHYSLKEMLNDIGIPTENMELDWLLPDVTDETLNKEDLVATDILDSDRAGKIKDILDAISIISEGAEDGKLVEKFEGQYMIIGNRLPMASDAFSLSSYTLNGETRNSYSAPDYISKLVNTISNTSTERSIQRASKFIRDNFGAYSFFNNSNNEYAALWLRLLADKDNITLREQFKRLSVLSVGGSNKRNLIGDVDNKVLRLSLMKAFYSPSKDAAGNLYGLYHNPLYSDVDALDLFKFIRYDTLNIDEGEENKDFIVSAITEVMMQELDRIKFYRKSTDMTIDNFNDERNNSNTLVLFPGLPVSVDEILNQLDSLRDNSNDLEYQDKQINYLKELVTKYLTKKANQLKESLTIVEKKGLLTAWEKFQNERENPNANKPSNEELLGEDKKEEDEEETEEEKTQEQLQAEELEKADKIIEDYYFNDFLGQTQLVELLFGDPAYAKNYTDFIKRNKQSFACGVKMFSNEQNGTKMYERCIYVEDLNMMSNTWQSVNELLNSDTSMSDMDKDILRGDIHHIINMYSKMYKDICSTDGQSYRSIHSFKKIFKALGGKWTDSMEHAYNNIINNTYTAKDLQSLWNPIKPFLFSFDPRTISQVDYEGKPTENSRREKIPVQHKNSEYMLTAMYSVLNTALNNSVELKALNLFMEKHNIDVVHFHSVVKVGFHNPFRLDYDIPRFNKDLANGAIKLPLVKDKKTEEYREVRNIDEAIEVLQEAVTGGKIKQESYNAFIDKYSFKDVEKAIKYLDEQFITDGIENDDMIITLPLEDMMISQPTDDHLLDAESIFGSQLRNIVPADLPEDFMFNAKLGGKKVQLTRDLGIFLYNALLTNNYSDKFNSLIDEFTDINTIKRLLDQEMADNPKYNDDVKSALEIVEIAPDTYGFKMPFNSPNLSNKIDPLLMSSFGNNIQRQLINGGSTVLVSSYGLSNKLKVEHNEDGSIKYYEAYLPAHKKDMYKDFLIPVGEGESQYWTLDFEKMKESGIPLEVIGFRIPTEDKYSIMPIKVMGFMPIAAGSTIMLPADIVPKSGTDYDIDKLFLMIKTFTKYEFGIELNEGFKSWFYDLMTSSRSEYEQKDIDIAKEIISNPEKYYSNKTIEKLRSKSSLFATFMQEYAYKYHYKTPKYVEDSVDYGDLKNANIDDLKDLASLDKFKIKSITRRRDIRNNMVIDLIWSILTSKEGSKLVVHPGNFDSVKHASRQQKIMHNPEVIKEFMKLKGITDFNKLFEALINSDTKTLEKIFEASSTPQGLADFNSYIDSFKNLMDGNNNIGISAVSSSSHYKLQFANLKIKDAYKWAIKLPGKEPITIDTVDTVHSPISGRRIGEICGETQAAAPDNGKDPCLGDIGYNGATAYRVNYLNRSGLSHEIAGFLNTIDDFKEYVKDLKIEESKSEEENNELFIGDISELVGLVARFRVTGTLDDTTSANIEDQAKNSLNNKTLAKKYLKWLNNIDTIALALDNAAKAVLRCDSTKGALPSSAAQAIQMILKINDFYSEANLETFPIEGLAEVIDRDLTLQSPKINGNKQKLKDAILNSPIPRLQATYSYGVSSAIEVIKEQLPQISNSVIDAIEILRINTKSNLLYKKDLATIKHFLSSMSKYFLSINTDFAGTKEHSLMDKRNYYIHDFPIKFGKFIRDHKELNDMSIIRRMGNTKKGIIMKDLLASTSRIRETYMDELDYLFFNENGELSDFGVDLLRYSYYDNGISFGHSNIGILFSTEALASVKGFTQALREGKEEIDNKPKFAENFCYQFLLNNIDLIPRIKGGNKFNDNHTELTISEKNLGYVRSGKSILKASFVEFIRTKGHNVYRYIGTTRDGLPIYRKMSNFKFMGDGTSYYDASIDDVNDLNFNELKERGYTNIDFRKVEEKLEKNMSKEEKERKAEESLVKQAEERADNYVAPDEESDIKGRVVEEPSKPSNYIQEDIDEKDLYVPMDKEDYESTEFNIPKDKEVVSLYKMDDTNKDVMC